MEEHKQYYHQEQTNEGQEVNNDFLSSGNVLATEKTIIVKNRISLKENEIDNQTGQKVKVKNVAASYSILLDDFIVAVTNVGTARTITLPRPALAGFGKYYMIKDASGSALTTTITIAPFSAETIDGDTTKVINTNYGVARLYTDATNWFSV